MSSRDTWLYPDRASKRTRERIEKSTGEAKGRIESPASDVSFRMLTGAYRDVSGPRITNWGGADNSSLAFSVKKAAPDYPASRQLKDPFDNLYSQGIAIEPPLPPESLLNLTEENTLHSGCLMAKAYDACGRGWGFKPIEGKESDKGLIESDLPLKMKSGMELLTPDITFGEMLYQAAWEMDAIGWSAWETVRLTQMFSVGKYAPIGAIYPIPSFTLRATVDPRRWVQIRAGRIRFFKRFGAKCEIDAETGQLYDWANPRDVAALGKIDPMRLASELIVFKSYTPRSLWYGIPKWISAVPTIAELTAIREFNVSWFASGGQTDYIVHFTADQIQMAEKMSADTRQQMEENRGRGHTNIVVAGTSDTKMAVQKLGELLREGHFRFRRGDLAKEVLIAHTVPPYRIGWAETGSLGGNAAQEMLGAYKYGAIEPIQVVIEDRLKQTLYNPDLGGIQTGEFRLKLEELRLDDVTAELDAVIKKVENMIMTPNQAREELGMEAVETPEGEETDALAEGEEAAQEGDPTQKAFGEPEAGPQIDEATGMPMPPQKPKKSPEAMQAEAMNKYYYKGKPIGEEPAAPAMQIGPDGKPMPPKPPFGGPEQPNGAPVPGPDEKAVDKAMETITRFEKMLRDALRSEASVVANETDAKETAPSERRPSRRSRRQAV